MKKLIFKAALFSKRSGLALFILGLLVPGQAKAGNWTRVATDAPDNIVLMLLLSDGSVMAANGLSTNGNYGSNWFRLTPNNGSYVNGNWTALAPMHNSRLWYSSAVLRDGRVFVAGGEYSTDGGGSTAEVYDPVTNSWTLTPPAGVGFSDSGSKILPDGTVLVTPVSWAPYPNYINFIYNPAANSWSLGNTNPAYLDEASWVKLPDDSIVAIDYNSPQAQRYIPSLRHWIVDNTNISVNLYDQGEMGAGLLLPNGRAFFLGGNGHTALYTPAGNTNSGTWAQGPDIPGGQAAPDAPAAMMVNGKILCAVGPPMPADKVWNPPVSFYEYDYTIGTTGAFYQVAGPTGLTDNIKSYQAVMLDLPDGNVLYSHFGRDLYVYQPSNPPPPLAAGKPVISSITPNGDGSYHLTGTKLNGISEGAAYGDDAQMDSNYPLVRLSDGSGHVYYARTYNWSSTSVQTGSAQVSTEFDIPRGLTPGQYSLVAVANGIASDPVTFSGPVWVDFNTTNVFFQFGTYTQPYKLLAQGTNAVISGGTINIKPGSSTETMVISKPMVLQAVGGTAVIGH